MFNLNDYNLLGPLFINYNKVEGFVGTILIKIENGFAPLSFNDLDLSSCFPNLADKIKEGMTLYINSNCGYVGLEKTEGPYCEQKVFDSKYESNNLGYFDLLLNLDQNIGQNLTCQRKLIKNGEVYL